MDTLAAIERAKTRATRTESGCLIWTGPVAGSGYPTVYVDGRNVSLHRLVLVVWTGYAGEVTRHLCHEPRCFEPRHLTWGSQRDNVLDTVLAGRHAYGTRNGKSRLDEADVREIRRMRAQGYSVELVARLFRVSKATVSNVANRVVWAHIEDAA